VAGTEPCARSETCVGREMEDDRLEAAREKLGRGSTREGSEAGEKVRSLRLDVEEDRQRGRLGSLDPNLVLQVEKPASEPWRLFFCLELALKSPSLRNPRS
jgi:hypothetical protein